LIIVSVKVSIWFRVSSGVGIGFRIMGQRSGSGVKSQDQGRVKGQEQWSRVRIGGRVMDRVQSQGKGQGQGAEFRVRVILRARVQGEGNDQGSGVKGQGHTQSQSAGSG